MLEGGICANSPPTVILPSIDLHGFAAGKNTKGYWVIFLARTCIQNEQVDAGFIRQDGVAALLDAFQRAEVQQLP